MQPADENSGDYNPYAPPSIDDACLAPTTQTIGMWREAGRLVLHRDFSLPPICARTLEPADTYVTIYTNFWRTQKTRIPISRRWRYRRWVRFFVYLLLSIALPFLSLFLARQIPFSAARTVFVLLCLGGAALFFLLANDQLWPFTWVRTRGPYIAIQGFSQEYLRRLPEWPGLQKLQQPVEM